MTLSFYSRHAVDFTQVAAELSLEELPSELYQRAIRLDGKGLDYPGLEDAACSGHTDLNWERRVSRIGRYQYDHGVLMFCNEYGEIYGMAAPEPETLDRLFRRHNYKDAARENQESWVPGSLYAAHVNGMLDKTIGQFLFGRQNSAAPAPAA